MSICCYDDSISKSRGSVAKSSVTAAIVDEPRLRERHEGMRAMWDGDVTKVNMVFV